MSQLSRVRLLDVCIDFQQKKNRDSEKILNERISRHSHSKLVNILIVVVSIVNVTLVIPVDGSARTQ